MIIVFQVAKTFAAKMVSRLVPGLLIGCCAVVPATESSPPGILCRLRYGWYMGSAALADDPPGIAEACEFGAYQFLYRLDVGGSADGII